MASIDFTDEELKVLVNLCNAVQGAEGMKLVLPIYEKAKAAIVTEMKPIKELEPKLARRGRPRKASSAEN